MKRLSLLLVSFGLLTLAGVNHAPAQTAQELLDSLSTQIRNEAETAKKTFPAPPGPQQDSYQLMSNLSSARASLDSGNDGFACQQLQQAEYLSASTAIRDACETIIRKIREERAAQQTAAVNSVNALLKSAGQAVVAAKAPKDLDAAILELSHAAEDPGLSKPFAERGDFYTRRLQAASSFVLRWQDCLAGLDRADGRSNYDHIRSLLADNSNALQSMEIPRSAILAHLPPALARPEEAPTPTPPRPPTEINADVAAVIDKLHTLDSLPGAIRELTALRDEMQSGVRGGYSTRVNELGTLLQRLRDLDRAYAEWRSGLGQSPESWWNGRYNNSGAEPAEEGLLAPLHAQLLTLMLPRLLGAPDTEKPASGEQVDAFLARLIDLARKRSDWSSVARGLEYRRVLLGVRSPYDGQYGNGRDDAAAFKQFFAGQNFEQASQYELAVAAYLSALSTGTQEIPVVFISERLAAIKAAHPKECAGGERAESSMDETAYENAVRTASRRRTLPMEDAAATVTPSASPSPSPSPSPASAASSAKSTPTPPP